MYPEQKKRKRIGKELAREQLVDAAAEALRKFGPHKATVVDVARILGVSHGNIYRYFGSKIELWNAVIDVWLKRIAEELSAIAESNGEASDRLRLWFATLRKIKARDYRAEAELFSTYRQLMETAESAHVHYYASLRSQLARILEDGVRSGEFEIEDVHGTAAAILDATTKFHHPWHAASWQGTNNRRSFEGVLSLIMKGISRQTSANVERATIVGIARRRRTYA